MSGGEYIHKLKTSQKWAAIIRPFKRVMSSSVPWWQHNNKRYGLWWRIANVAAALLILGTISFPILQHVIESRAYHLSPDTLKLVGKTDDKLAKKLTYNSGSQIYQFNKDVIPSSDSALATMQAQIGGTKGAAKNLYAVDVAVDGSKGVTYYDANSGLSFSMVPEYSIGSGKNIDGHIVYPLNGDAQAIYTLKNNGLKEDIVVNKSNTDTLSFSYKLDLPNTLQMKAIPNSGGAVGVYSADQSLYGNVNYGSDADKAAVQKARENAQKNYLVFGLPSPVIKNIDGKAVGNARFVLAGNTLTVVASGLKGQRLPVSIDPSVVVTSTTDFQYGGNDDGNISFATSGQATRAGLTGGSIGPWSTTTPSLPGVQYAMGFVTYNNYLYVIPGFVTATTYYTHISSDGTLDGWNTTNSPITKRSYLGAAAYNGYMYAWGGYDSANSVATNSVEYARINTDGTLGSWQTTGTMYTAVCRAANVVQGGYLYAMGGSTSPTSSCGNTSTGVVNTVQYAPINADGTVGTWATTTALNYGTSGQIMGALAAAYNGYVYVMGGSDGPVSTQYSNVQYAPINADGTLGTWVATTSMLSTNYRGGFTIYDGYIYTVSDQNSSTTVRYAPINASGAVGTWRATTSITNGRWGGGLVGYNGNLYFAGGSGSAEVNIAKINPAGQPSSFSTTATTFTTARALSCSVAYNGYLYTIGGSTSDSYSNNITTVRYAALDPNTGQTGTWGTATALPTATGSAGCIAYNGYIYLVGGFTGTGTGSGSNIVRAVPINANGTLGSWSTKSSSGLSSILPRLFIYSAGGNVYLYALTVDYSGTGYDVMRATITNATTGTIGSWTGQDSSLPALNARAFAQVGNHLYAMGGTDGTNHMATVYYTTIASDGSVANWQATASLNTAISFSAGVAVNGCIYNVGGEDNSGALATVQYACPSADGTISTWYNAPNLSTATTDMGIATYNGYIYGVGGYTNAVTNNTQFAYVDNGGAGNTNSTGALGTTTSFTTVRRGHVALAYNGRLYIVGGLSGGSYLNDVQYATINSDGTIGSWATTSSFSGARSFHGAVAYNGYMYIAGGYNSTTSTYYNDSQYAKINADGTLGAWTTTTSFTTGRNNLSMVAYRGNVYVLGGYDGTNAYNDVRYAAINTDGSLGSWTATSSFRTARSSATAQIYNGYMYIAGGGTGAVYSDVQYAPINNDGTLGTWVDTTSFNLPRQQLSSAIYGGFFYIFGGANKTPTYFNDVQYAQINSNGTLGPWLTSNSTIATARSYSSAVAYQGTMYLTGGYNGTTSYSDVEYTSINAAARIGHYSKLIDFGAVVNIKSITYNGTMPSTLSPGVSPVTYRSAASNGVFNATTAYSNVATSASSCDTASNSYTRYLFISILLDDSTGGGLNGGFPDASGTNANVTDITVTYSPVHVPPNIRLRAGQSLQLGSLTPLDTCYP